MKVDLHGDRPSDCKGSFFETRKILNDIATNTGINLDNNWLITNHSCHHIAIQLLKNNGVLESELQAFSRHRSCESLADYCKTTQNLTETQSLASNIQSQNITKEILSSTQPQNDTIVNSDFTKKEIKKSSHVSKIPRIKPHTQNSSYLTSSVIALFKPPYSPNSPMLESYKKHRKPLLTVNNIVIQLPLGISQSYDLNINLKIS
ncbi:27074_t:CDS:2 [Dentiscutata erythropus]|uniref:27074_t:CDS:1 n=1 Tax=Dentiscutata erythropus TaxID=1348616 RepID=A0A9N9F7C1_9GLOM|nr:27074_t:CDS:2 [Dentiscutata erythropus]